MEPATIPPPAGTARLLRFVTALVSFGLIGFVIWVFGAIGAGQHGEDLCFGDLDSRPGYGATSTDIDLWPPSFECHLRGSAVEPIVVQHRLVAIGTVGAWLVVPVVVAIGSPVGAWWVSGRRLRQRPAACA